MVGETLVSLLLGIFHRRSNGVSHILGYLVQVFQRGRILIHRTQVNMAQHTRGGFTPDDVIQFLGDARLGKRRPRIIHQQMSVWVEFDVF